MAFTLRPIDISPPLVDVYSIPHVDDNVQLILRFYTNAAGDASTATTNANAARTACETATSNANTAIADCRTAISDINETKTAMDDYLAELPDTIQAMFEALGLSLVDGKLCTRVVRDDE